MLRTRSVLTVLALSLAACGGSVGTDAGPHDAGPYDGGVRAPYEATHTFPAITLEAGGEVQNVCQSWTLNNTEPLYVAAVNMRADEGWHHSNWMFVPDTAFQGPDGTWPCSERSFTELNAALQGGAVFFAQSTQSTGEEMRFPAGYAYVIPPYSRVIGSVHVLNFSPAARSSALTFTIDSVPASEVTTELSPLAIDNEGIRIPPRGTAIASTSCNFAGASGGAIDWSIVYVLPHYHTLATEFRLDVVGGPRDGTSVFSTSLEVGDPLGAPLDPPFDMTGATGLSMHCSYANPGSTEVTYGASASDEMCLVLAYTTADRTFGGSATDITDTTTLPDGTVETTTDCFEIGR